MPSLRTNIIANYAGQIWTAIMMVAFVPLYLQLLGAESYGLVGIMLGLQAISQLFDFGVGGAVNRELAMRSGKPELDGGISALIRTLEWIVWPMSIFVGILIIVLSEWIATSWLNGTLLSDKDIIYSLKIIGIAVACLWPSNFYLNCLSGLEKQPLMNALTAGFATLRYAGVLPVLYFIEPSIIAFLYWGAFVGLMQSCLLAIVVWRKLPCRSQKKRFSRRELFSVARFSGGLFLISMLALSLTQIDRFFLAGLHPLSELGYYTVALTVAAGIGRLIQPLFNALYPRFSRLLANRDNLTLSDLYHQSSQWAAAVLSGFGAMLVVFSEQIIFVWTGDLDLALQLKNALAILVAGTVLNGLVTIPYALQLASGWTKLSVLFNLVSIMFIIPFGYIVINLYGMEGAASVCLLLNLCYICLAVPLIVRRLLPGEWFQWFFSDSLPSFITAFTVAFAVSLWLPEISRDFTGFLLLTLVFGLVGASSFLSSSVVRKQLVQFLKPASA
jgi:O-antigen/teichoic acid export membrane protein